MKILGRVDMVGGSTKLGVTPGGGIREGILLRSVPGGKKASMVMAGVANRPAVGWCC
jgi:hypothetical protein